MLKHCVPIKTLLFPTRRILDECVQWRNSMSRFAYLYQGNENIKYFISKSENQTENLLAYRRKLVPLDHNDLKICIMYLYKKLKEIRLYILYFFEALRCIPEVKTLDHF